MRRARIRSELPRVALVGYTNAGKSTLFNALTGADAYAADQLFATLDPTVRRIELPGGGVVLADTVGFVRDLPHELVAAFRSTLSEAREADLLLHVVDAADPLRDERIAQVDEVLREIDAGDIPQLRVFNKIDRIEGAAPRIDRERREPRRGGGCPRATATGSDLRARRWAMRWHACAASARCRFPSTPAACARACTRWKRCAENPRRRRLAPARGPGPGRCRAPAAQADGAAVTPPLPEVQSG